MSFRTRVRWARTSALVAFVTLVALLSGCAGLAQWGEEVNRALNGVEATMTTYDEAGQQIDEVVGTSFRVTRDDRFDTSNSEGASNNDSQVLMISLGDSHISHVGSSLVLAESGIVDLAGELPDQFSFENAESGTPWLNDIVERHRNLWEGKAKTIVIRSQTGAPIAVFAGDEVEAFATDVPKSTAFRVDGRYLFVYRSDYTVYDTDLLG